MNKGHTETDFHLYLLESRLLKTLYDIVSRHPYHWLTLEQEAMSFAY